MTEYTSKHGFSTDSKQRQLEYVISSVLGGREGVEPMKSEPNIPGIQPTEDGNGVEFLSGEAWSNVKGDLFSACHQEISHGIEDPSGPTELEELERSTPEMALDHANSPKYKLSMDGGKAIAVTFIIDDVADEDSIQTIEAEGRENSVVKVGWLRSMFNSFTSFQGPEASAFREKTMEAEERTGRNRKMVKALVSSTDKLLDIVSGALKCSSDLETFMRMYRILGWGNRILHPMIEFGAFEDGTIFRVLRIFKTVGGEILPINNQVESIVCGLRNQGNTCFMNSGLQCLMNCQKLSEYFMNEDYRTGLSGQRDKNEMLIEAYAELVSQAYSGECRTITPSDVKASIGLIYEEYNGNDEQDVVEFVTKILDTLHEGLNEARLHPEESRKGWWRFNKSLITSLFFFNLKSTLLCRECEEAKISFEPAMCLPLPIPHPIEYKTNIVLFYAIPTKAPMKIYADASMSIRGLKELLNTEYGVLGEILCIRYHGNRDMVELTDDTPLKTIPHVIFCHEYIPDKLESYYWLHIKTRRLFVDKSFEFNLLINAPGNDKISIYREMRDILTTLLPRESLQILTEEDLSPYFKLELPSGTSRTESIIKSPVVTATNGSDTGMKLFGSHFDPLNAIKAVDIPIVTIHDCLDRFLESENLHFSTLLHCDKCSEKRRFTKKIDLKDLPKYLIIQLKRFQYIEGSPVKINTLVDYPLEEFLFNGIRYKVIGICNHDSDKITSSGHYVAYVRKDGWYLCNDQKIRKVDAINKEHTYVLFLEKCI